MAPINIDGTAVSSLTIDGTTVQEVTMDGDVVFSAVSVVDDFEDGNMNEYSANFGSLSNYSAQQATPNVNGTNHCEHTGTGNDEIHSTSGLDNYPSPGDTYVVHFRLDEADSANSGWLQLEYGVVDSNNYYYSMIGVDDGDYALRERTGGSDSSVASTNHTWSADQWYRVEMQFGTDGNAHTHTLYNHDTDTQLEQLSGTPSEGGHTGGIGYYSVSMSETWWTDYNHIK